MKRWILVRQALAVSHSYGTQFYLIGFALVFVPWYDVTIPGRHDYAYKKLFQGWTPIRPEVSVRLKDISNFKHWRNRCWLAIRLISQQNRDTRWRLPVPNSPLCHWSSHLFDFRTSSSTDVPVLLLNQPNIIFWCVYCSVPLYYVIWKLHPSTTPENYHNSWKKFKVNNIYKIFRPSEKGSHLEPYSRKWWTIK